ncbi:hypothetical protein WA1_01840 [Scytonema hofmannii PCC 7110]|uniref:Blue (type 1) copper domain-containing protein n=1 Tax=Scytonema hofmannii PCC 7110 TaxID=128403 RepID=A0A139XGU8_9CYAN|nr:plastocyanin/azurin family copper-binding protein [Scytonema hofmannii]KYC43918.1 hypothetical protein WA1_01840 [Scytonema hofmannii PCC 7110]
MADPTLVKVVDFRFEPSEVKVEAGSTVKWVNEGSADHTVTRADEPSFDRVLAPGEEFEFTFANPSDESGFEYRCRFHSGGGMRGKVIVTPEVAPTLIKVVDFLFEPSEVEIEVGTTVKWINEGSADHTVTRTDEPRFDQVLAPGEAFEFTFANPSDESGFEYRCRFHSGGGMRGKVIVKPAALEA